MRSLYDAFEKRPDRLVLVKRAVQAVFPEHGSCILEVGCGKGEAAAYLAQHGFAVVAIDINQAEIDRAKEIYTEVCFACADAARLPFCAATFDLVFCEASFSSVVDKASAAKEFFRVLKPSGKLIVCDYTIKSGSKNTAVPPSLAGACSLEDYHRIFESAGFHLFQSEDHMAVLIALVFHLCRTYRKDYSELMTFLGAGTAKYGFNTLIYTREYEEAK